ncbi:MAG: hypothetical protein PWP07_661 [Epulopiscium sp.]|jgi:hypothetical protein|uniref:Flagellar protein FlgN n=1 Tax=Defluviitalea raffinosedens TaxID=1450156 RepID=A0A7C8HIW2_9FIRM|nr:flagellar export chaperone FlgN [Defluviitalea raffinosedens]MBZ4668934.1 hypothetical protein [Defluviitaleaceae bacterium]MDK2787436.1 hypothetical protein [Candidatus Epulonipiscium sp.]KAE9635572.1 hypothetical protein GND95_05350 [Defluviitalea raffinosedens]MBM7684487.1 hypothetical protein [Defluviitalea raffinosedens]HHW68407.1 hypothetical protein [Candidatus Epulonipiscium sp.]
MTYKEVQVQLKILLEILNKKKKLLEQIYTITENQALILGSKENNMDLFDQLSCEKKQQIDQINDLDKHFDDLYKKISYNIQNNVEEYKDLIKSLQDQIKIITDIGVKIQIQEEKNSQLIQMKYKNIREEIKSITKGKVQAVQVYKNIASFTARKIK